MDLQDKIDEVIRKHQLDGKAEALFPNYNAMGYPSGDRDVFSIDLTDRSETVKEDLLDILDKMPKTNVGYVINLSGKKVLALSFRFTMINTPTSGSHVLLCYSSNESDLRIKIPRVYYSNDIIGVHQRRITSSEHHYFLGESMANLGRIRLTAYQMDMFERITWYGGDVSTYINHEGDVEEWEHICLNGNIKNNHRAK